MHADVAHAETRWKQVRSPYDLKRAERFNARALEGRRPLAVTTSGDPWSYAVGFRYRPPWYDRACRNTAGAVVRVRATVERGEVGIGVADAGAQAYLDETVRRAGPGEQTFDLLVDNLADARWLIVRDGGEPGGPSRVVLHSVGVFRVPPVGVGEALEPPRGLKLAPVPGWSRYYGTSVGDLADKVRSHQYRAISKPLPMRWLDGLRVLIHPNNGMCRALYVSGLYEPTDAVALRRLLPEGGTFFDVGANMGVFSLLGAAAVGPRGKVVAFEPSGREFGRLSANLELNGLTGRVRSERVALSDREGTAGLHVAEEEHSGHNTLGEGFAHTSVAELAVETVPVQTLDAYVRANAVRRLDVVKIDVEGAEYRVLAGAEETLRTLRPRLLFELFEPALRRNGSSPAEVQRLLERHGYVLREIDETTAELRPLEDLGRLVNGHNAVAAPREAA